jgi:hypothetical protein
MNCGLYSRCRAEIAKAIGFDIKVSAPGPRIASMCPSTSYRNRPGTDRFTTTEYLPIGVVSHVRLSQKR